MHLSSGYKLQNQELNKQNMVIPVNIDNTILTAYGFGPGVEPMVHFLFTLSLSNMFSRLYIPGLAIRDIYQELLRTMDGESMDLSREVYYETQGTNRS